MAQQICAKALGGAMWPAAWWGATTGPVRRVASLKLVKLSTLSTQSRERLVGQQPLWLDIELLVRGKKLWHLAAAQVSSS